MKRFCIQVILSAIFVFLRLSAGEIDLHFKEATWFPNEVSTAFFFVSSEEEPDVILPESHDDFRFYGSRVDRLESDKRGNYAVVVEFVPKHPGFSTFPSVKLKSDESSWASVPSQIFISQTIISDSMSLEILPAKTKVYEGEPVRLDFVWKSSLELERMRSFRLAPAIFNSPDIKVFIPRSQVDPDLQIGLPVGGRRVIGHRVHSSDSGMLGEVRFSIWVRFESAGHFEISDTRLSCSYLEEKGYGLHQYASYFNNSLFEAVDRSKAYQKLLTKADGFSIEVLPLPAVGREESFSGLFSPDAITLTVVPDELEVGQLMEIRLEVKSEASSEMLELAPISLQSSLRHRFWVAGEQSESWLPDGRSFVVRARPLSSELRFFPSLSFQVFDVEAGEFRTIKTKSIPLRVVVGEGGDRFSVEALPGAKQIVESNQQGIWYNKKKNVMKELVHNVIGILAEGVWVFLLLGPLAYFLLRPWVRELRRRVEDEVYDRRRLAYRDFCKRVDTVEDRVELLRELVARSFDRSASSVTADDSGQLLLELGCDVKLANEVAGVLREKEEAIYSDRDKEGVLASPRSSELISDLGRRVYQVVSRGAALVVLIFSFTSCCVETDAAEEWEAAEKSFEAALDLSVAGGYSDEIEEAFAKSALAFEASAKSEIRPGSAWYNAGNAWFKAGELGRSIAAYRRAQAYSPFDRSIGESLAVARALNVDAYADGDVYEGGWSSRWSLATFSLLWLIGWGLLLLWKRFQTKLLLTLSCFVLAGSIFVGGNEWRLYLLDRDDGVLIVDEAFARKGPGFAYQSAFLEPLHNGTEFSVVERRGEWLRVSLANGEGCWLPAGSVEVLDR